MLTLFVSSGVLRPFAPRASPLALRALRDLALVDESLAEAQAAVRPVAEFGTTPAAAAPVDFEALTEGLSQAVGEISSSMRAVAALTDDSTFGDEAFANVAAAPLPPMEELRGRAVKLQRQVEEQRLLLTLIESEKEEREARARDLFDAIDVNGNGMLEVDEFVDAAQALLNSGLAANAEYRAALKAELAARFAQADTDGNGTLSFGEFFELLTSLKGNASNSLRKVFSEALVELLNVTLQIMAWVARGPNPQPIPCSPEPNAAARVSCSSSDRSLRLGWLSPWLALGAGYHSRRTSPPAPGERASYLVSLRSGVRSRRVRAT